jgi:hypothetical protein
MTMSGVGLQKGITIPIEGPEFVMMIVCFLVEFPSGSPW